MYVADCYCNRSSISRPIILIHENCGTYLHSTTNDEKRLKPLYKISTKAFSVVLPGLININLILRRSSFAEMNSGPLSTLIFSGSPRLSISLSNTLIISYVGNQVSVSLASTLRINGYQFIIRMLTNRFITPLFAIYIYRTASLASTDSMFLYHVQPVLFCWEGL
jgi:hypothetical protein